MFEWADWTYKMTKNTYSGKRLLKDIDRITPHCTCFSMAGENLGKFWNRPTTLSNVNFAVGNDGKIMGICPMDKAPYTSSSKANDFRAVTIEMSSAKDHPYQIDEKAFKAVKDLIVNVMKDLGKTKLVYIEKKEDALKYKPSRDEMLLTFHFWFKNKSCPGKWFMDRVPSLVLEVNNEFTKRTEVIGKWYGLMVGSYANEAYAKNQYEKILSYGINDVAIREYITAENKKYYRVVIGKWVNSADIPYSRKNQLSVLGLSYTIIPFYILQ